MTEPELEHAAVDFAEGMKKDSVRRDAGVHLWPAWALVEAFKAGAQLAAPAPSINIARMEQALASESIPMPAGLTKDEMDAFILSHAAVAPSERQPDDDLYFLQDKRSFVGNCAVWWAQDGKGYTTQIALAHRYTKDQAFKQHGIRQTDVPWPCAVIEPLAKLTIDVQDMHRTNGL